MPTPLRQRVPKRVRVANAKKSTSFVRTVWLDKVEISVGEGVKAAWRADVVARGEAFTAEGRSCVAALHNVILEITSAAVQPKSKGRPAHRVKVAATLVSP